MPAIHHKLFIAASADSVFEALTTQTGLAAWWTPAAEAKTEVGSVVRFPFGDGYRKEMNIESLQHNAFVQWTCLRATAEWVGTTISFTLTSGDKPALTESHAELSDQLQQSTATTGTVLTFQHDNWKTHTAMFAECSYTWALFLRSLKRYCETGKGTPWPTQHQL